jgi:hypothetical protein
VYASFGQIIKKDIAQLSAEKKVEYIYRGTQEMAERPKKII